MVSLIQHRSRRQWHTLGLMFSIAIALVGILALQVTTLQKTRQSLTDEYVVRKEQNFAIASTLEGIGFGNLAASWLWLEFIQYYGDTLSRRSEGYSLSYDYLKKITELDDQFLWAYRYISPAVAFSAGQPEKAEELILAGLEAMTPQTQPDGYRLHLDRAVNQFLLIGDAQAGRAAYYAAADWYERADLQGTDPDAWRQLADRLVNSPNRNDVRFTMWNQVFYTSADPVTRDRALLELRELGAEIRRRPDGQIQILSPAFDSERPAPEAED